MSKLLYRNILPEHGTSHKFETQRVIRTKEKGRMQQLRRVQTSYLNVHKRRCVEHKSGIGDMIRNIAQRLVRLSGRDKH